MPDLKEASGRYFDNITKGVTSILGVESGGLQLIPKKVYVKEPELSISEYNKSKVSGRSWRAPVYADLSIKDSSTGKEVQSKDKVLLGYVPSLTPIGSFLLQGNDYYVPNQFRLKPGVYARERNDGLMEAWLNTAVGRSIKITFDSDKEDFNMLIAGKTIPLFPVLQSLAKDESQLRGWFGDKLAIKLTKKYKSKARQQTALNKLHQALFAEPQENAVAATENIRGYWAKRTGALNPDSTEAMIGVRDSAVSPEVLGRSAKKLLNIFKGEDTVDDRDNLIFKAAMAFEKLVPMRLFNAQNVRGIQYKIKRNLAKKGNIRDAIPVGLVTQPISKFFLENGGSLAVSSDQTNTLSMFNITKKTTILGEGSISSPDAIVETARDLHPTKMGIIDPVFTPESEKVGVVEHLARGSEYNPIVDAFVTSVIDRKTGKEVKVETSKILKDGLAIRDQFKQVGKKYIPKETGIWAYQGNQLKRIPESDVRYIFHKPENLFSETTNLVPFLNANSGPRLMMASKMMEQAVPLIREMREAPLVETVDSEGNEFSKEIVENKDGEPIIRRSDYDGVVKSVSNNSIVINTKKGPIPKELYYNHPLAAKTFLSNEPVVEKGQKVKKGDLLADTNHTKDGRLAIGKNLTVAYMPFRGYTLDDGIAISESAARKMTSQHMYKITVPIDRNTSVDKKKFRAAFPGILTDEEAKGFDEDGVVKEGEVINEGSQLALAVRKLTPGPVADIYMRLKRRSDALVDSSVGWDRSVSGTVAKVNKMPNQIEIHIKTEEPIEIGDKLSNRHGHKGIVSAVIPDKDMPRKKDGTIVDVLIDPVSVPGRSNLGQIFELAAAKMAQHDGKAYKVYNFEDGVDFHKKITSELKQRGISDKELLYDANGKAIGNITVGPEYIMKLQHKVASKMSARERGGYDLDQNPLHGGAPAGKAKGVDRMILYALLASGAKANLKEMSILKGTRNEEYWRALESGDPLPSLKTPFATNKLMAYLNVAGVNIAKEGTSLKLLPMTDGEISALSSGKITNPKMLRAKDLKEEEGGLFDPVITGGVEGKKYSHMDLPEPMPNPVFEKAIASVLEIREKDIQDIVSGKVGITKSGDITKDPSPSEIGGAALEKALKSVDVKKEIKGSKKRLEEISVKDKPDVVNKINRRIRYLSNLNDIGIEPSSAYISKKIAVLPPIFRPVYPLPSGDLESADINYLYRDMGIMSIQLNQAKKLTQKEINSARSALYDAIKTYTGVTSPKYGRPLKGILEYIGGRGSPKRGYFQSKVLRKEQDLSGRSVVTPNPELGPDEVEIPKEMAWKLYRPLVIQNLVASGLSPAGASDEVDELTSRASRSLDVVMSKHPVMLNRAPTLHKFGMLAFHPKVWSGKTIRVPHLIAKGYNLDFDGDEMSVFVPATPKAAKEASALFPSANLFNPGTMDIMLAPSQSTIYGLSHATTPTKGKSRGKFKNANDVVRKIDDGVFLLNDPITFNGKATTPASVIINERIPEASRNYSPLNEGAVKSVLRSIADTNTSEYGYVVSEMKKLGDEWAITSGLTIGLEDIAPIKEKDPILRKAISLSKTPQSTIEQGRKVNEIFKSVLQKTKASSSVLDMLRSGAISKGKQSQVKQILISPVMAQNYRRQPIPVIINSSYSEGLKPTEYWAAMFGARAGMMDRALSTSLPGAFSKEVLAASVSLAVTEKDCGTSKGKAISISDPFLSGRLLSKPAGEFSKNSVLDGQAIKSLKSNGIKSVTTRSPSTCEAKKGICQKCYGINEYGSLPEIGENIGAISGTTITEPITQMAMTGFHTSGVVEGGGGVLTGSPRIFQLLRLPTFVAGAATIARKSGKIDSIQETEAGRVKIDLGGSIHYAQPGIALKVKKGDSIKKGQPLTGGLVNPRDIMITKGLDAFRGFLSDELKEVYSEQNKSIDPRHFEVISRVVSSHGMVTESGDSSYIKGDLIPIGQMDKFNQELKNKIQYSPYLRGVNTAPLVSSDWLARMGFQQIRKTVQEGAASGWSTEVGEQGHPIASYVYGTEFSKGDSPALLRLNKAWLSKLKKAA
jgi:DNA-directed RNA polymerase subunit beta'